MKTPRQPGLNAANVLGGILVGACWCMTTLGVIPSAGHLAVGALGPALASASLGLVGALLFVWGNWRVPAFRAFWPVVRSELIRPPLTVTQALSLAILLLITLWMHVANA